MIVLSTRDTIQGIKSAAHIFVYGTLKRRGSNHSHMAGQRFVAEARTVPGFTLIDLGAFPGMVRAAADGVKGEVWAVDQACLERLDKFEELDVGLFERAPIALAPPFPAAGAVDAYLYVGSTEGRAPLGAFWPV